MYFRSGDNLIYSPPTTPENTFPHKDICFTQGGPLPPNVIRLIQVEGHILQRGSDKSVGVYTVRSEVSVDLRECEFRDKILILGISRGQVSIFTRNSDVRLQNFWLTGIIHYYSQRTGEIVTRGYLCCTGEYGTVTSGLITH